MNYIPHYKTIINAIIYTFALFGFCIFILFILLYTIFDIRKTYVFSSVEELINRSNSTFIVPYILNNNAVESIKVDTDIELIATQMTYTMPSNTPLNSDYTNTTFRDTYGNKHIMRVNTEDNTIITTLIRE